MLLALIPILILAIGLGIWGAISPEGMWNTLSSWRYRDREANRPSRAQLQVSRVGSVIAIVVGIALIPVLINGNESNQRIQQEEDYQDCLAEYDDDEGLLSPEEACENLRPDDDGE